MNRITFPRTIRSAAAAALFASLSAGTAAAAAQQPLRVGAEFQVNSYTQGSQLEPKTAAGSNGDFVIVWVDSVRDGDEAGLFAQRFSSAGARLGAEFQVNSYTVDRQYHHEVAAASNGDFLVVWQSIGQDGDDHGVFGRRFSSSGTAQAGEFQISVYTTTTQDGPAVAAAGDGRFVVVWHSVGQDGDAYGMFARRFDAAGNALGGELQVSTYTTGDQTYGAVGIDGDGDGDFVVTWVSRGQDGSDDGVFARRFDSAGMPLGSELQVNTYTMSDQNAPRIGVEPDGDFVIAWASTSQDGDFDGVFAQRFDSSGTSLGVEFRLNSVTAGAQHRADVVADGSGFVIAWDSIDQDGDHFGVFAQRFDAGGSAAGVEFQVNSYTVAPQVAPALVTDGEHRLVIAWLSTGQDGDVTGVFAQRYVIPAILDVDGDGSTDALTDGLLTLRYHFGFVGNTLIGGAVGPGCTRCTPAEILGYLQSID